MTHGTKVQWLSRERVALIVLLGVGALCLSAAPIVGVSDNLPGVLLCYGGVTSVILAFAHRWRKPRWFSLLTVWSLVAFIGGAFLHNAFEALAQAFPDLPSIVAWTVQGISVATFLVAVLLAPPGALVGLVGFLVARVWQWAADRHAAQRT